jgi:hypothetical protein
VKEKTMKRMIRSMMLLALTLTSAATMQAQSVKLDLRFDDLEARAEETVDVNLDGPMLRLASKFLSSDDPEEKNVQSIVSGLTGIYVRSYTFAQEGAYSRADVERVRGQLGREWQRIVTVRSKKEENVDIYMVPNGNTTRGIVIIAAEPREFTIVQLIGSIDLDRLSSLEGEFGIPEMELQVEKGKKK